MQTSGKPWFLCDVQSTILSVAGSPPHTSPYTTHISTRGYGHIQGDLTFLSTVREVLCSLARTARVEFTLRNLDLHNRKNVSSRQESLEMLLYQ